MQLIDYIKDKEIAVATEIYNAKFKSVEDVVAMMKQITEEKENFNGIINEFNTTLYNIKVCLSKLAKRQEDVEKFNRFKNSYIAGLLEQFINNNTEDNLEAIKKAIEQSNEFGVHLIPEWKPGKGERMYGTPSCAYFHIDYTNTYYTYNNWDIDKDVSNAEKGVKLYEEDVQNWIGKKEQMYDEYGFDALTLLFEEFEKKNGLLMADEDWWFRDVIYDDDDDEYDEDY